MELRGVDAGLREIDFADVARLDAMLVEGLRSGDSIPVDAKFWNELKQEAITKLAARKRNAKK